MKAVFEPISSSVSQSFNFNTYESDSFETPWHYHPQWELTLIQKGEGLRSVGNSIETFNEEELVLIAPNLPHCWKSATENDQAVSTFIQFDDSLLGKDWNLKIEFQKINYMLKDSEFGLLFDDQILLEVKPIFLEMKAMEPIDRLIALLKILKSLSTATYRQLSLGAHFKMNTKLAERIEIIVNYIEANYTRRINLDELGELLFMTPVSFSKFFKNTFQKTFTYYLNEYRIGKACTLLRQSVYSVEEIAFRTGYQNLSFFHRQFKKFMRITPSTYRKQYDY